MFTYYLLTILCILFIISILGYLLVILKEKYYLSHNIIFLDCKGVSQNHLDEVEAKCFTLGDKEIMSGDEMKIYFNNNRSIKGIILGAKLKENRILLVTAKERIESISIKDIQRFKIISKYGKIFKRF
ncbi:MAG TPA: hypothetical protein GX503_00200 [Clostridiales bacterium]|nr:hypothetical protein [Clostridiales bacterium]